MSSREELIANQMSLAELQEWLGVDSLVYLSVEDMVAVAKNETVCRACFNGEYLDSEHIGEQAASPDAPYPSSLPV
jgi:glutamine phosphoribosylpyrophosphate amidotransferase